MTNTERGDIHGGRGVLIQNEHNDKNNNKIITAHNITSKGYFLVRTKQKPFGCDPSHCNLTTTPLWVADPSLGTANLDVH